MGRSSDSDSDHGSRRRQRRRRRRRSRSASRSSSSSLSSSRSHSPARYRNGRHSKSGGSSKSKSSSSRRHSSQQRHRDKDYKSSSESRSSSKKSDSSSSKSNPSFVVADEKTPEELLKLKLQMALKAAADADALLREQGVLTGQFGRKWEPDELEKEQQQPVRSFKEQIDRANAIDEINAPGFAAKAFMSGVGPTPAAQEEKEKLDYHDAAIFGTNSGVEPRAFDKLDLGDLERDNIAHENFFIDPEIKEDRWIRKLMNMRQRQLNGEAMF